MSDFTHPDDAGPDHPGYVTREGRPARIVCTDAKGRYPILALTHFDDWEVPLTVTSTGQYSSGKNHDYDLIDAPKPKKRGVYERWVNVYADWDAFAYATRADADRCALSARRACIHIRQEWEEGEGL